MERNHNPSVSFKSALRPVQPFIVKTNKGNIYFKEINYNKPLKKKLLHEISVFFLDNFASTSSHPFWKKCKKNAPAFDKEIYNAYIKENLIDTIVSKLKTPDTTLMIGRNTKKNISAAIFTNPLNLTSFVKENNTLYIDLLAVHPKYRGNNIGRQLLTRIIDSSQNRFTDAFLVAYNESVPFYEKLGFKNLENKTYNQQIITDSLARERKDYPVYASFMTKPINKETSRWYNRMIFY